MPDLLLLYVRSNLIASCDPTAMSYRFVASMRILTRKLRGNVVIPSVARAAEEMVLNAVEADASVVEAA